MLGGGDMPNPAYVGRQCTVPPAVTAEDKVQLWCAPRGLEEKLVHARFPVGHPIAHEQQVTPAFGFYRDGKILVGVDRVVHQDGTLRSEVRVCCLNRRTATVEQD